MFYGEVFKALEKAKVKYVVAGGVAVVLHGYPRLTVDLDLVVYLEKENLAKCFDAMASIGYIPKVPVRKDQFIDAKQRSVWEKEKGMIVFSFVNHEPPFQMVDIFIRHPLPFKEIFKKRVVILQEGFSVSIMAIDQLITLKTKAGRDKDLDDIVQLQAIKKFKRAAK